MIIKIKRKWNETFEMKTATDCYYRFVSASPRVKRKLWMHQHMTTRLHEAKQSDFINIWLDLHKQLWLGVYILLYDEERLVWELVRAFQVKSSLKLWNSKARTDCSISSKLSYLRSLKILSVINLSKEVFVFLHKTLKRKKKVPRLSEPSNSQEKTAKQNLMNTANDNTEKSTNRIFHPSSQHAQNSEKSSVRVIFAQDDNTFIINS